MKEISLTQNEVAIVDDAYYDYLMQWKWWLQDSRTNNTKYAIRAFYIKGKRRDIQMHRLFIKSSREYGIDHIDGNGLNNQLSNIRLATNQQNQWNCFRQKNCLSKYKGVHWHKGQQKWQVDVGGKYFGLYGNAETAALVYNEKAKELYGDFARLNKVGV